MNKCPVCKSDLSQEEIDMFSRLFPGFAGAPSHVLCAIQVPIKCDVCDSSIFYAETEYSDVFPLETVCHRCTERYRV